MVDFNAAFMECEKAGQWQNALSLLHELREAWPAPDSRLGLQQHLDKNGAEDDIEYLQNLEAWADRSSAAQQEDNLQEASFVLPSEDSESDPEAEALRRQYEEYTMKERDHFRIPIQPEGTPDGPQFFEHTIDVSGEDLFGDVTVHLPDTVEGSDDLLAKLTETPSSSLLKADSELFRDGYLTDLFYEHTVTGQTEEQFTQQWLMNMKYFRAIEKHLRDEGVSPQKYDIMLGFWGMRKQSHGFPEFHVDNEELQGLFQVLLDLRWSEKQADYHPMALSTWNDETHKQELYFDMPMLQSDGKNGHPRIGQRIGEVARACLLGTRPITAQFNSWFIVEGARGLEHFSSFKQPNPDIHTFPRDYAGVKEALASNKVKAILFNAWARKHRGMPIDKLETELRHTLGDDIAKIYKAIEVGRSRELRFVVVERARLAVPGG